MATDKSKKIIIITLFTAFFGWGAWAYFVNLPGHDSFVALRSALAQSVYSTVMTLYMSASVLFIERRTRLWKLSLLWPTLGTVGHTGPLLVLVHVLNHTPNIFKTVSMPILVSSIYCFILSRSLQAKRE